MHQTGQTQGLIQALPNGDVLETERIAYIGMIDEIIDVLGGPITGICHHIGKVRLRHPQHGSGHQLPQIQIL